MIFSPISICHDLVYHVYHLHFTYVSCFLSSLTLPNHVLSSAAISFSDALYNSVPRSPQPPRNQVLRTTQSCKMRLQKSLILFLGFLVTTFFFNPVLWFLGNLHYFFSNRILSSNGCCLLCLTALLQNHISSS